VTVSRTQQGGQSPLQSDRGTTTIQSGVVSSIAAMAVGEVDGLDPSHGGTRLPGDTSPTVGEFVGNLTGGSSRTRGISVEVGEEQAALDLTPERTFTLNWAINNSSVTELRVRRGTLMLSGFNNVAHLELAGDPGLLTYR